MAIPRALATLSTDAAAFDFRFDPFMFNFRTALPTNAPARPAILFGSRLAVAKNTTSFIDRQSGDDITRRTIYKGIRCAVSGCTLHPVDKRFV